MFALNGKTFFSHDAYELTHRTGWQTVSRLRTSPLTNSDSDLVKPERDIFMLLLGGQLWQKLVSLLAETCRHLVHDEGKIACEAQSKHVQTTGKACFALRKIKLVPYEGISAIALRCAQYQQ